MIIEGAKIHGSGELHIDVELVAHGIREGEGYCQVDAVSIAEETLVGGRKCHIAVGTGAGTGVVDVEEAGGAGLTGSGVVGAGRT